MEKKSKKKKRKQRTRSLDTLAKPRCSSDLLSQVCVLECVSMHLHVCFSGLELVCWRVVFIILERYESYFYWWASLKLRNADIVFFLALTGAKKASPTWLPLIGSLNLHQVSQTICPKMTICFSRCFVFLSFLLWYMWSLLLYHPNTTRNDRSLLSSRTSDVESIGALSTTETTSTSISRQSRYACSATATCTLVSFQ